MKTIEIEWITDRVPTRSDFNHLERVIVPAPKRNSGYVYEFSKNVREGEPWHPAFKFSQPKPIPPAQVPWGKPSDVPKEAVYFRHADSGCVYTIKSWYDKGCDWNSGGEASWEELSIEWRYSDRPFDNWEDGKPCCKEGGAK